MPQEATAAAEEPPKLPQLEACLAAQRPLLVRDQMVEPGKPHLLQSPWI